MNKDNRKKIVCFDIDMTLLNHKTWEIPQSALDALEQLRESFYIIISTGRDMDAHYSSGLKEIINPDGIIHLNGTKITVRDKLVFERVMEPKLVENILKYVEGKPFAVGMSSNNEDYYVNPNIVEALDYQRFGASMRTFVNPYQLLEMKVYTMAFIGNEEAVEAMKKEFPQLRLPMFAGKQGADLIDGSISKGDGLKYLCDYFKISIKDTIAFGDSMNDYEILEIAGLGIAMGNSIEELKGIADYVTDEIDHNGIWNACKYYKLI